MRAVAAVLLARAAAADTCATAAGKDVSGQMVGQVPAADAAACCTACAAEPKCRSATFYVDTCYMKDSAQLWDNPGRTAVTPAGVPTPPPPPPPAPPAPPDTCQWQSYASRGVVGDYKNVTYADAAGCRGACCNDTRCVGTTVYVTGPTTAVCYLHDELTKTQRNGNVTIYRKRDRSLCGPGEAGKCASSAECPRFSPEAGACADGLTCGCACYSDADCEQDQMDVGCPTCGAKDTTGLGRCGGASNATAPLPAAACTGVPPPGTAAAPAAGLDIVFVLGAGAAADWTDAAQLAARTALAFDVVPGGARAGVVRFGGSHDEALVPFGSDNATLLQRLSMVPPALPSGAGGLLPALRRAGGWLNATARRRVVVVATASVDVDSCGNADAPQAARALWGAGVEVFVAGLRNATVPEMLASPPASAHFVALPPGGAAGAAAGIVAAIGGPAPGPGSVCGRRCTTFAHCGGNCSGCDANTGTCGAGGSCGVPVPPGQPHLAASAGLELVFIVKTGSNYAQALTLASRIGLSFTTGAGLARYAVVTYADDAKVLLPFGAPNASLSAAACGVDLCGGGGGARGLASAVALAAGMFNASGAAAPAQHVVLLTNSLQASLGDPSSSDDVVPVRSLWRSGVAVSTVLTNQTCAPPAPSPGNPPPYTCDAAAMAASAGGGAYDLRTQPADDVVAGIVAAIAARAPPAACTYGTYADKALAASYETSIVASVDACTARCCADARCKAATTVGGAGAVTCALSGAAQLQATHSGGTTVHLLHDATGIDATCYNNAHCGFPGAPTCNVLFNKCQAGYACNCACYSDADCEQGKLGTGCSTCDTASSTPDGFGRCRSSACGRACSSAADCGAGCATCANGTCVPPSPPPPPPENCLAPFPGQPHKNCSTKLDLMFLLDASGSVPSAAWTEMKRFTAFAGVNFTSGDQRVAANLGLVQFSSDATTFIPFTDSNATFLQTLNMMPQLSGGTNTASGFDEVERVFNASGRAGGYRVLVLMTDGMWNAGPSPVSVSQRMQANGVTVFAIAIGEARSANVKSLASSPQSKYYYNVTSEDEMPGLLHSIIDHICDRSH